MMGSHKSEKCFEAYPELKRGRGDKRDRERDRSKSRSQSRGKVDKNSPSRYNREEDTPQDRDRDREDRRRHSRLTTPRIDVDLTRRVKPRYDFLDEDSGSFEELRRASQVSKQPLRRVREVLDKKGVTDTIKDMFNDHFEDLMFYLKEKLEEGKQKEETKAEKDDDRLQEYINRIRRVRCYRVNKKRHSPVMMGRLLGKSSNKKEVFIADTGTIVIIIPVNMAKCKGIVWTQTDPDEPLYAGVTGVEVDVWTVFDNIKGGHNIQVLITRQEAEEILIDLIDLSIVPPDFPLPQDPE